MRRGVPQGYTIVEVMIFLAVTGALFAMIVLVFAGQRGRTQFQTSAREVESRVRDVINDVSTGYYQTSGNFACTATASGPSFTGSTTEQGTHQACIFIGRIVQFNVGGNGNLYNIYSAAGLRREPVLDKEVENFSETKPKAIDGPGLNVTEQLSLPNQAKVASIFYNNGVTNVPIEAVGLFTTFGKYDTGALQPGSLSVNVVPLPVPGSSCGGGNVTCQISELGTVPEATIVKNPTNGVTICFDSGTSDQHGRLAIGGSNRQLTTDLVIGEGPSSGDAKC